MQQGRWTLPLNAQKCVAQPKNVNVMKMRKHMLSIRLNSTVSSI
jgi:hypothetical protein